MAFKSHGSRLRKFSKGVLLLLLLLPAYIVSAQSEGFLCELRGTIAANDSCITADDKFNNISYTWADITNLSVDNLITFEIRVDTNLFYYNTPFECTVNFTVEYDTVPGQASHATFTQSLTVRYDNTAGSQYKGIALLKFKKGHWVKLKVNSISSPQFTTLPAIFRIKNEILIERKYAFSATTTDNTVWTLLSGSSNGQLLLNWDPSQYEGAETYDIEWTFIDKYSAIGNRIESNFAGTGGTYSVPADTLAGWMLNNCTRVTVPGYQYQLNIPYDSGFVLFRIRGIQINAEGYRIEGDWNYSAENNSNSCSSVVAVDGHEPNLNWQYSAVFAEEGKRKEVISYFDGSLRNRQSVTLNNSDKVGVVGQSIYDEMGRPAVNVLPAPVNDTTLHYYRGFNKNTSGDPYSFNDFLQDTSCGLLAGAMSSNSGSSKYYSPNNPFPQTYQSFANKFIPQAENYPFSVTKYTGDNTGRVRNQGGVGPTFQLGSTHETKYFYGKPSQTELDRMFGSEAGDASHYLKNMVMDANGQLSVSYTDASGKTIATALAGINPPNLEMIKNEDIVRAGKTEVMLRPRDFIKNSSDNSLTASSTFLVALRGDYNFTYEINPSSLVDFYGSGASQKICSDCYYDVEVRVINDCGVPVQVLRQDAVTLFDTSCSNQPVVIDSNFTVSNLAIGEYNVVFKIFVSRGALKFYTDHFVETNTDLLTAWYFIKEELKRMDLTGCYSDCKSCETLGTKTSFITMFENLLEEDSLTMDTELQTWLETVYDSLKLKCQQLDCSTSATPVCEKGFNSMAADVSPGGQYALLDTAFFQVELIDTLTNDTTYRDSLVYTILEYDISVLKHYTSSSIQFLDADGVPDTVVNSEGTRVLPNELTLTEFVNQWKSSWASALVPKHPEYCFYLWCLANEASNVFDDSLNNFIDNADTAIAYGYFNPNTAQTGYYLSLLNKDPFFKTTSPQGKGYLAGLRDDMESDLTLFSRKFFSTSLSDKNILQTIDQFLYCDKNGSDWGTCAPTDSCRSREQEWMLYKTFYLNLKRKYYREAMTLDSDTVYSNCKNCYIKDSIFVDTLPAIVDCPLMKDIVLSVVADTINNTNVSIVKVQHSYAAVSRKTYVRVKYTFTSAGCTATGYSNLIIYPGQSYASQAFYNYPNGCFSGFYIEEVACTPLIDSVNTCGSNDCPSKSEFYAIVGEVLGSPGVYELTVYNPTASVSRPTVVVLQEHCELSGPNSTGHPNTESPTTISVTFNPFDASVQYCCYQPEGSPCSFIVIGVYCPNDTTGSTPPVMPAGSTDSCSSGDGGNDTLYRYKRKVYEQYQNFDGLAGGLSQSQGQLQGEYHSSVVNNMFCESMADSWMLSLSGCTNMVTLGDSTKYYALRTALIEVCRSGSDITHVSGSSTVRPGSNYVYSSFREAIEHILGPGIIDSLCSDDLLEYPYPYDKQPVSLKRTISNSDSCVCARLQQLQSEYNQAVTGGFVGTFHQYLQSELDSDYTLTETQLQDLIRSCNSCNYVIRKSLTLPISLDCRNHGPVICSDIADAVADFEIKYPGYVDTTTNYQLLFTTFMNHRFGYTLTYGDYQAFLLNCDTNAAAKLYNKVMHDDLQADSISCVSELYNLAVNNGYIRYRIYIDSVRRDFQVRYMTRCLNANASLSLSDSLYEYHYTLYYYDQAGNLVKTVPPAGVNLLTDSEVAQVRQNRELNTNGCYSNSNYLVFNPSNENTASVERSGTYTPSQYITSSNGDLTTEFWVKLSTYSDQGLITINLSTPVFPGSFITSSTSAYIASNKLVVTVFAPTGMDQAELSNIGQFIPLNTWTHIVVRTGTSTNYAPQVFINSEQLPLVNVDDDYNDGFFPNSASQSVEMSVGKVYFGGGYNYLKNGSVKQVRFYKRLLSAQEILRNAFDMCLMPADQSQLISWLPLNDTDIQDFSNVDFSAYVVSPVVLNATQTAVLPDHVLPTSYQYNTLNQVIRQHTPDADSSWFWYDRLGRLVVSQNREQHNFVLPNDALSNRYSYTLYDSLSRIVEVGEKIDPSDLMTHEIAKNEKSLKLWNETGTDRQVTYTVYDEVNTAHAALINNTDITDNQRNLRKRVVTSYLKLLKSNTYYNSATHYTYDISGNVDVLWQDIYDMRTLTGGGVKRLDYDYDLVSGKVNKLSYQKNKGDQFFYKYLYDADNRVIRSLSSRDGLLWINDASYNYYLHGPLSRTELGEYKVQGQDYAYTLQGWLKGVNGTAINPGTDMGRDAHLYGSAGEMRPLMGKDVHGFMLHYYDSSANSSKDYKPIALGQSGFANPFAEATARITAIDADDYKPLYNGNISGMAVNLVNLFQPVYNNYRYDQLNRLTGMDVYSGFDDNTNAWTTSFTKRTDWKERVEYDGNGNILKYLRNGNTQVWPNHADMDSLNYQYNRDVNGRLTNNRLNHVRDAVSSSNYGHDIDNQSANNYSYDKIGNLTADGAEGIDGIVWTVYGKIDTIVRSDGRHLVFRYDPSGNRISKKVSGSGLSYTQYYIRDAQGNTLGIYRDSAGSYEWEEQHLYGNSRLGTWRWSKALAAIAPNADFNTRIEDSLMLGSRVYELSNHLGNVLSTISDKKVGVSFDGGSTTAYYNAEIINQQDYYPFGMMLTGRAWHGWGGGNQRYRYGFNGKENDNEVKGENNQVDFEARIYDPRVGRFASLDPLQKKYPHESNYAFVSNSPLLFQDYDGRDKIITIRIIGKDGKTTIKKYTDKSYSDYGYSRHYGGLKLDFFKRDIQVNYVVDLSKETVSFAVEYMKPTKITVSDYVFRKNESFTQRVGFLVFGTDETGMEYQKKFPKAADGSTSLELKKFISVLEGWREFTKNFKQEPFDFAKSKVLKRILEAADNFTDGVSAATDANDGNFMDVMRPDVLSGGARKSDSDKFIKKGAVYYDKNTGLTIERDTDSTGRLTNKKAKDTLPKH